VGPTLFPLACTRHLLSANAKLQDGIKCARARGQRKARQLRMRVGIIQLERKVADAVRGGKRGESQRGQHTESVAVGIHEAASRVSWDARSERIGVMRPVISALTQTEAGLG